MSNTTTLSWSTDLAPLSPLTGSNHLAIALEKLQTKESLITLIGQYVAFNAPFGSGVAHLAGQTAVRQDLFRDRKESAAILADRSGEIAKHIFAAAVDEFGGAEAAYPSHRALAQDFLKGMGRHFGHEGVSLNALIQPNRHTLFAEEKVKKGYGFGGEMNEDALLKAIGFHMGSEYLAGDEFRTIDAYLRTAYPDLVASMEKADAAISTIASYIWVKIHTTVEEDHAAHAFTAANLALESSAHPMAKERVLEGFRAFADIQTTFINHIAD